MSTQIFQYLSIISLIKARRYSLLSILSQIIFLACPISGATKMTKSSNNIVLKSKSQLQKPISNPPYQAIVVLPLTGDKITETPPKQITDAFSSFWVGVEEKEHSQKHMKSSRRKNKGTKNDSIFSSHLHKKETDSEISHFLPTMRNGKLEHIKMQSTTANNTLILFYDYNNSTNTTVLPDVVYHGNGTKVNISDVVKDGLPILMEHPPQPPNPHRIDPSPSKPINSFVTTNSTSSRYEQNSTRNTAAVYNFQTQKKHINPHDWENMPQAQDQMIIVSTVATMALLVGALSARRLRSRHFLSSCIENESLEDELAYDTAYTTTGGRAGGYDTFNGSGSNSGLPWRGDLEKFDV